MNMSHCLQLDSLIVANSATNYFDAMPKEIQKLIIDEKNEQEFEILSKMIISEYIDREIRRDFRMFASRQHINIDTYVDAEKEYRAYTSFETRVDRYEIYLRFNKRSHYYIDVRSGDFLHHRYYDKWHVGKMKRDIELSKDIVARVHVLQLNGFAGKIYNRI